jgi:hypothetical protein
MGSKSTEHKRHNARVTRHVDVPPPLPPPPRSAAAVAVVVINRAGPQVCVGSKLVAGGERSTRAHQEATIETSPTLIWPKHGAGVGGGGGV